MVSVVAVSVSGSLQRSVPQGIQQSAPTSSCRIHLRLTSAKRRTHDSHNFKVNPLNKDGNHGKSILRGGRGGPGQDHCTEYVLLDNYGTVRERAKKLLWPGVLFWFTCYCVEGPWDCPVAGGAVDVVITPLR